MLSGHSTSNVLLRVLYSIIMLDDDDDDDDDNDDNVSKQWLQACLAGIF